jgi:hypothetical protein
VCKVALANASIVFVAREIFTFSLSKPPAQDYVNDKDLSSCLLRFEGDLNSRGRPDPFGSLRPGGGMHLDGYGTAHRQPSLGPKPNIPINDGYGTARSVKKVYL